MLDSQYYFVDIRNSIKELKKNIRQDIDPTLFSAKKHDEAEKN